MIKKSWDDIYEVKTVSAKLSKTEFLDFKIHCDTKGLTPSTQIKELIKNEIKNPIPINIAGKNLFVYNKYKDNFSWKVILDNGLHVDVEYDLSSEYIRQLFDSLKQAVDERETYIKKDSKEAVSIPSKLIRGKI
ncbi:MAG: hypothetical protein AABX19_03240 [Nanoarchaeota archaeon]